MYAVHLVLNVHTLKPVKNDIGKCAQVGVKQQSLTHSLTKTVQ
jgi:hypothetical protein